MGQLCRSALAAVHATTIIQATWLRKMTKRLPSWLCSFSLKLRQHSLTASTVIDQIWVLIPTYLNFPTWLSKPTHIALSGAWVSTATPLFFFFFCTECNAALKTALLFSPVLSFWPPRCYPHSLSGSCSPTVLHYNLSLVLNDHENKVIMQARQPSELTYNKAFNYTLFGDWRVVRLCCIF